MSELLDEKIDINEKDLLDYSSRILPLLLKDNSSKKNIIWATSSYEEFGDSYSFNKEITIDLITGKNDGIIKPRVVKSLENQAKRTKEKAEVFTPAWVCNAQSSLFDEAWFEQEAVFNKQRHKSWETKLSKIEFSNKPEKSWKDYVQQTCLEITCGEAPYLVSRYDSTTAKPIAIIDRIGLLDRKLRVVNENTSTKEEWLEWVIIAFQHTYGYEWQGDNLLLARENLFYTFIEYYQDRFNEKPLVKDSLQIANIISWNIWQMDGLKYVIPCSCTTESVVEKDLFGEETVLKSACVGCKKNDIRQHNGIYCKIKDWQKNKTCTFVSLAKDEK